MAIRLDDFIAKLPKKRQEAIAKRTAELIAGEATLRQVRETRERSHEAAVETPEIQKFVNSVFCNYDPFQVCPGWFQAEGT